MKKMKVRGPATLEERVLSGLYLFFSLLLLPFDAERPSRAEPKEKGTEWKKEKVCERERGIRRNSLRMRYSRRKLSRRAHLYSHLLLLFFPILLGSLVYYTLRTHLFACFRRRDRRTHEAAKPLIIFPFRSEGGNWVEHIFFFVSSLLTPVDHQPVPGSPHQMQPFRVVVVAQQKGKE